MKTIDSIAAIRAFRDRLIQEGIPVQRAFLFGSVAQGTATEDSDIDVAFVCLPFRKTQMEENIALARTPKY